LGGSDIGDKEAHRLFKAIDVDNSGGASVVELRRAAFLQMREQPDVKRALQQMTKGGYRTKLNELEATFKTIDTDGNGE
jgi:Ca2+-binding EF-hand superfamily protein